ncbi:caspase family protein [Xanthobacter oligotrophicus]|uniref:caspase family protein n=1 Tax=Xanthobacter oligotrophicus TaxID=2607286 RepID=UPI001E298F97|nr:caspase family protein [Xanthobacter oligotrophicus]MCG5233729.1 caspase family protein [Xanthobacter oligotrophicus]
MRVLAKGAPNRRGRGAFACLLVLAAGLVLPNLAFARNLALLVGVADYDEPKIRALAGPRNDVILLWRYLTRHAFDAADIEVLAEGLPEAADTPRPRAAPVRAAILEGLARLADRAGPGDFVLFHFSGHGTTQPEVATDGAQPEAGGLDQVLLPKDSGLYDPVAKTIRNAIIDNELGAALDRIRAKGATVWVVVDACHAGTVTRSAEATRGVDSTMLGVPPAGPEKSSEAIRGLAPLLPPAQAPERNGTLRVLDGSSPGGTGSLIAFFAVDSWTPAIERAYPAPAEGLAGKALAGDGPQATFGVFTWHLLRALETGRARSFRDLARMVSLDIAAAARVAHAPLPVFEGDLGRGLLGAQPGEVPRFAARRDGTDLVIEAGALQGFDEGSEIALFDGPLPDARRLGMVRLATTTASESRAAVADLPEPAGRTGSGADIWAQMERPGVAFRFRVAGIDHPDVAGVIDLAFRPREGVPAIGVELVAPGQPADLRLHLADGRIWLVPEGSLLVRDPQAYGRSVSIPVATPAELLAPQLRNAVWAYARTANLVRIASVAEMGAAGGAGDIDISLDRIRETDPERLADPRRGCGQVSRASPPLPVDSGTAAAVAHCDTVRLTIANRSEHDVDLGIFFLDPLAGIDVPVRDWRQNGCIATLPAKASGPMVLRTTLRTWGKNGPSQIGLHRILVFVLPRTGGIPPSLCHLLQRDVEAAAAGAAAMRGGTSHRRFVDLLGRAALVDASLRAANPFEEEAGEAGSVVVRQFTLDLLPPEASR